MIIDEFKDQGVASQLMMSQYLAEVPQFGNMIRKLIYQVKEQLLHLNPEAYGFNLRYRELQFQVREYEGIMEIIDSHQPDNLTTEAVTY